MNYEQNSESKGLTDTGKISVLDLLIVFAKYRKILLFFPLLVGVIAAIIAFLMPPVFRASATFLPPQQAQSGASILAQLGGADGLLASAAGIKSPGELYVGMLKSRTIADSLIAKFDLVRTYGLSSREKTRVLLAANTTIATGKDGMIAVAVEDKDKNRAAALANAYVAELSKLTKTLAVTSAAQRRLFYEGQLNKAKEDLAASEMKLKSLLKSGGIISVDTDSKVIAETIGKLRARISAKEIELNSIKAFVTSNNQEYRRSTEELQSLRAELDRLQNGTAVNNDGPIQSENNGLGNVKLLRDVKYNQMLYELLAKQFEAARLEEAREGPLIQVLDPAIEPENKFKPKRAFIILIALLAGELLAIGYVFVRETLASAKERPEVVVKLAMLKKTLAR